MNLCFVSENIIPLVEMKDQTPWIHKLPASLKLQNQKHAKIFIWLNEKKTRAHISVLATEQCSIQQCLKKPYNSGIKKINDRCSTNYMKIFGGRSWEILPHFSIHIRSKDKNIINWEPWLTWVFVKELINSWFILQKITQCFLCTCK